VQIVQKVQSEFLHGDIDDIGDIAIFATFANAFFLCHTRTFADKLLQNVSYWLDIP